MSDRYNRCYVTARATSRGFNGQDQTHEQLLVGTPEDVANSIAGSLKYALSRDGTRRIELTTIHPINVHEVNE